MKKSHIYIYAILYKVCVLMRLLELRISNKLSQKELGKALDLTQQRISLLEQGKSYPNSIEITKYATYFDVSADYVLEISPRKNPFAEMEGLVRGNREILLLKYYSKLNENMKKYILEMTQKAQKYQGNDETDTLS